MDSIATTAASLTATAKNGEHDTVHESGMTVASNIILLLCLLLMSAFILFGNVMIVLAVLRTPRIRDQPNHRFIISLAFADGVMGLSVILMALRYIAFTKEVFYSNKWACLTAYVLSVASGFQSLVTLTLMAIDRLVYVQNPFIYSRWATDYLYAWIAGTSWMVCLAFGTFPFYYNVFDSQVGCVSLLVLSYDAVRYVLNLPGFFCMIATNACYIKIALIAKRQRRKIQNEAVAVGRIIVQPKTQDSLTSNEADSEFAERRRPNVFSVESCMSSRTVETRQHQGQKQCHDHSKSNFKPNPQKPQTSTGLFLTLNCVFTLCWLPFLIHNTMAGYLDLEKSLGPVMFIAMSNSGMNVVIYAYKNKDFRHAFRKLLTCSSS